MACVGKNSLVQMANVLVDCTNVLMDDAMHILIERFLLSQCATEVTIYMIREILWSLRTQLEKRFFMASHYHFIWRPYAKIASKNVTRGVRL